MIVSNRASHVPDVFTDVNGLKSISKSADSDEALKEVAKQFESLFINIMLKNMRAANAVFEEDSMVDSNESRMFRDMYDNQMSLSLAKGKGIGLADTLYQQLKGAYGSLLGVEETDTKPIAPTQLDHKSRSVKSTPVALAKSVPIQAAQPSAVVAAEPIEEQSFSEPKQFVEKVFPIIQKAVKSLGFNPVALLAQTALETGWGKYFVESKDGESSYNLFNIKADSRWQGEKLSVNTLEYKDGVAVKEQAQFRKYKDLEQSVQDYIQFLKENPRYESAVKQKADPVAFFNALQTAGYATDPQYANKIASVMATIKPMVEQTGASGR